MNKADNNYTLTELCKLFNIKPSTYYYQQQEKTVKSEIVDMISLLKITAKETNNTYGKRRMLKALRNNGFQLGITKTASLMKKAHIVAKNPKKKHHYPDSGEVHDKAPNVLKRQFNPDTVNTHWVGDITYIRTHQGWSYLASVLDLGSREIVGFAMSQQPNTDLAIAALKLAIQKQQPDTKKILFQHLYKMQTVWRQYKLNVFS